MAKNAKRLPLLAVELTRAESFEMAMALTWDVYPTLGYPYDAVRRAANEQFPRGLVVDCFESFSAPIRSGW